MLLHRRFVSIHLLAALSGLVSGQSNHGANSTCQAIAKAISPLSEVFYPGASQYSADIKHWVESSTQQATCSVEPGSVQDVSTILKILGSTRTPFAVKGGGHSFNLGFSSTTGVQIAMTRFSNVTLNKNEQTAEIGPGMIWHDVYEQLAPFNVTVVGGRVPAVGVAGFTLGGGLSYTSSQHGLAIDTVQAFELVLPNGTITTVTADNKDLFFGLKGGFNNFGIVTKFTFKTFPQGEIWAANVVVPEQGLGVLNTAVANFAANNTDPKVALNVEYSYASGVLSATAVIFYDAPTPPPGLFDALLSIPGSTVNASSTAFFPFVSGILNNFGGSRISLGDAPVAAFSPAVLNAIVNETSFWGQTLTPHSASLIMHVVEIFLPTYFSHGAASAYPPNRSAFSEPIDLYFAWNDPQADDIMHDAVVQSQKQLKIAAIADGQKVADAPLYPNYAPFDTPLELLYGSNVNRLRGIKRTIDPYNVMGLAGGFKF
ncbi:hypothetical protein HETIRDRAFT_480129 [Heterobasidion irregulare TC 32-1]|uniref:FAD-binding PCMH-type domain-containing protein n=1 Tax=Heterobasidion irregulare (strain TC 32-1) TaxID=747525 RepID=W4JWK2_HETIT|nr:uncharacterized protein HETIRDRAFT_480129 [Heterobasidion irregulare TC 32-1]ETW77470.1 hypothetical protein HETIRDRAFT_480129 [Heterobasidion irregulare TC 32-1]